VVRDWPDAPGKAAIVDRIRAASKRAAQNLPALLATLE
jgi:hypothetical protein